MSEEKKLDQLADSDLEAVSGGMTRDLRAAYACIRGDYGNGQDRRWALAAAGYDPDVVQGLVNAVLKYENVAQDVIAGKYGNGDIRMARLRAAGYPAEVVQNLVNHMVLD